MRNLLSSFRSLFDSREDAQMKGTTRTETPFNPIATIQSMDHRWPSMGFELWPSAWGHLWSILMLNISNFNLLSFPE